MQRKLEEVNLEGVCSYSWVLVSPGGRVWDRSNSVSETPI